MDVRHLNISLDLEDLTEGAFQIAKYVKSTWKREDVQFRMFTEGITNMLVGVYNKHDINDIVLVRIYGESSELFIDRDKERESFTLMHDQGIAPRLFLTFENGMAFEYISGTILSTRLCQNTRVYPLVARMMAKMHKINYDKNGPAKEPRLWHMCEQFIDLIPERYLDTGKESRFRQCCPRGKHGLKMEIMELKEALQLTRSPVVFCHNDLLLANVIYNEDRNMVTFIDYEYAAYNYQAFDIATHFAAFADEGGFDNPQYPNEEYQINWIREYLKEFQDCASVDDDSVQQLYHHVCQFMSVATFFVAIWNFMQAELSVIEFDYIKFGIEKYQEYRKFLRLYPR